MLHSWQASRTWSAAWKSNLPRSATASTQTSRNMTCCWTSRPVWSWRSQNTEGCWMEKMRGRTKTEECLQSSSSSTMDGWRNDFLSIFFHFHFQLQTRYAPLRVCSSPVIQLSFGNVLWQSRVWLSSLSGHKGHHRGGDSGGWKGGRDQQDCGRGCGSDRVNNQEWKMNKDLKPSFFCAVVSESSGVLLMSAF